MQGTLQAISNMVELRDPYTAKPWVLFVGFVAPHFPLVVPQRFLDAIDIDAVPLPLLHQWLQNMRKILSRKTHIISNQLFDELAMLLPFTGLSQ